MKEDPFAPEYKETIEADAVCNQCGKVNPEGTLICKTCGNNLRDQRLLRLAADQILVGEDEAVTKRSFTFLKGALTALALLLILWLGLNAGRVTSSIGSGDEAPPLPPAQPFRFWEGEEKAVFDALAAQLNSDYPTESMAETARLNPVISAAPSGRFVLFEKRGSIDVFVGGAYLAQNEGGADFVAVLTDGTEVRGTTKFRENYYTTEWNDAGVLSGGKYDAGVGNAMPQADGSFLLFVQGNNRTYQVRAYSTAAL